MNTHTPEQVKETISLLPDFPDTKLVHYLQTISSKHTAKDKKLYAPLYKAIEKERKSRGTAKTISSKPVQPKTPTKTSGGANADDYE